MKHTGNYLAFQSQSSGQWYGWQDGKAVPCRTMKDAIYITKRDYMKASVERREASTPMKVNEAWFQSVIGQLEDLEREVCLHDEGCWSWSKERFLEASMVLGRIEGIASNLSDALLATGTDPASPDVREVQSLASDASSLWEELLEVAGPDLYGMTSPLDEEQMVAMELANASPCDECGTFPCSE